MIFLIDFDDIKKYDYRQVGKTSISMLYYLIYKKILDSSFIPTEELSKKIINGLPHNYYKNLYNLFFHNKIEKMEYLLNKENMPPSIYTIEGTSKLLLNLVNIYNNNLK